MSGLLRLGQGMLSATLLAVARVAAIGRSVRYLRDWLDLLPFTPEEFGALNDGVTDDKAAIQAALDYILSLPRGGTLLFAPTKASGGSYKMNSGVVAFPSFTKSLAIEQVRGSRITFNFGGANAKLFDFDDPTNRTNRGGRVVLKLGTIIAHDDFSGSSIGPILINKSVASDLVIDSYTASLNHYRNNTAIRISAAFNCRGRGGTVWGAGHRKPFAVPGSTTFSVSANSTALTSSASFFDVSFEGKYIFFHNGGNYERHLIQTYNSATSVTLAAASHFAVVTKSAAFEGVKGAVSSGSARVTMAKSCMVASDDGRIAYVLNARGGRLTRAQVKYVSGTQWDMVSPNDGATLILADTTISAGTNVIFSPAVDIFSEKGATDAVTTQTNDFIWHDLHEEQIVGTGLVVDSAVNMKLPGLKLHGQNDVYDASATEHKAIFNSYNGSASGDWEGMACNDIGQIAVMGGSTLDVGDVTGNVIVKQPLIAMIKATANARVWPGRWALNNNPGGIPTADFADVFKVNDLGRFAGYDEPIASGSSNISIRHVLSTLLGGLYANDRGQPNTIVLSAGKQSVAGDAQVARKVFRARTTDATPTRLTGDGAAAGALNVANMPDNSAYAVRGHAVTRATSGHSKSWTFEYHVRRGAGVGTVTVDVANVTEIFETATAAAWDLTITADTTNGGVALTGTGSSGQTVNWTAILDMVEVVV